MKIMICKQEKGFEPVFLDINTLDELLNVIDEHDYPPIQINIEDDEQGNQRTRIEILRIESRTIRCGDDDFDEVDIVIREAV